MHGVITLLLRSCQGVVYPLAERGDGVTCCTDGFCIFVSCRGDGKTNLHSPFRCGRGRGEWRLPSAMQQQSSLDAVRSGNDVGLHQNVLSDSKSELAETGSGVGSLGACTSVRPPSPLRIVAEWMDTGDTSPLFRHFKSCSSPPLHVIIWWPCRTRTCEDVFETCRTAVVRELLLEFVLATRVPMPNCATAVTLS